MYKNHVFISYAHIDNISISEEQQGWISRFHKTFSVFLSQRLGTQAQIWRDQKLQGNDIFGNEIIDQFQETALFLSIISPRYIRSLWCKREITEFCKQAESDGSLILNNKSRVFKVVKTPIDRDGGEEEALPAIVRDSLGYEFYVNEDHGPIELDPDFGESYKQDYLRKVCILANNAAELIKNCNDQSSSQDNQPPDQVATTLTTPARKTIVFLASCSFDQRDHRELIEADLRSHGYRVLPEEYLPSDDEEAHRNALAPLLDQAHVSIHLIGHGYGAVPDGPSHQSVVEIQNSLAAERSRSLGLQRLIWLPESISSDNPAQLLFLTALRQQAEPQLGADLLQGSLEELRSVIHSTLDELEKPKPLIKASDPADTTAPAGPEARMIYLICVQQDRKQTMPLRKWLKGEGYEVSLPAFEGDAAALREVNQSLLRDCSAVLLFYGNGDEAWQRSVNMDIRRAPVYREGRPLPPPLTYLASPNSDDKDDMVDLEEPNLVDGRQGFAAELLLPFLQSIS